MWRVGAVGGCIGSVLGILLLAADWEDLWDARPWQLAALIATGIALAAAFSLLERYPDAQIARSIDRRFEGLQDRLTTVYEPPAEGDDAGGFLGAVRGDAAFSLREVRPAALYPLRARRSHWVFLALAALCALLYVAIDTPLLRSLAARNEAAALKRAAVQVQAVAKPIIEQAKSPTATSADKQLARDLQKFSHELQKGRMTRQQALIRANQLAAQAQQIQSSRNLSLSQSLDNAQTAGAKMQQMAQMGQMQPTDAAKLASAASALQQQMANLQNQLNAAKAGKSNLSAAQQKAIEQKLAALAKQLQQIHLSQQAEAMLQKLRSTPQFQQAMDILRKLQQQAGAQQSGQPAPLTQAQVEQMADQLEQLAKQLSNDAAMKAYAQQLLDAAKQARLGQPGNGAGLLGAFGMGAGQSQGGLSLGMGGKGAPSEDTWVGDHGGLQHFDKSSLLHLKYQDKVITSQQGAKGSETYTEELGPAQLGGKSSIPYQDVLPKYEKSAESALSKGDVPPAMRAKVRDYFESLHQGQ